MTTSKNATVMVARTLLTDLVGKAKDRYISLARAALKAGRDNPQIDVIKRAADKANRVLNCETSTVDQLKNAMTDLAKAMGIKAPQVPSSSGRAATTRTTSSSSGSRNNGSDEKPPEWAKNFLATNKKGKVVKAASQSSVDKLTGRVDGIDETLNSLGVVLQKDEAGKVIRVKGRPQVTFVNGSPIQVMASRIGHSANPMPQWVWLAALIASLVIWGALAFSTGFASLPTTMAAAIGSLATLSLGLLTLNSWFENR